MSRHLHKNKNKTCAWCSKPAKCAGLCANDYAWLHDKMSKTPGQMVRYAERLDRANNRMERAGLGRKKRRRRAA